MSGERLSQVLAYALMLLLPLSALLAQRLPIGRVLRMALAWIAIFAVCIILVSRRDAIAGLWSRTSALLITPEQTVTGGEVRIRMADDGHFWADATINGVRRRMLVDSGATTTALSVGSAEAAKLELEQSPFPAMIGTANGDVVARVANVLRMIIGDVVATDLSTVVSPAFGDTDVLGMNFLSRLGSWRVEGRTLILEAKSNRSFT